MSIKLTTQMDWMHYSSYSKNHPDNLKRHTDLSLPDAVAGPPPVGEITELDKRMTGVWGSKLCCEKPYGKNETRVWQKDGVTAKVGKDWGPSVHTGAKSSSVMKSAMYAGPLKEPSFEQMIINLGPKK